MAIGTQVSFIVLQNDQLTIANESAARINHSAVRGGKYGLAWSSTDDKTGPGADITTKLRGHPATGRPAPAWRWFCRRGWNGSFNNRRRLGRRCRPTVARGRRQANELTWMDKGPVTQVIPACDFPVIQVVAKCDGEECFSAAHNVTALRRLVPACGSHTCAYRQAEQYGHRRDSCPGCNAHLTS